MFTFFTFSAYKKERMENTCFCSYADGWCASCKRKYEEEEEERAKPWQQIKQEAIEELAFTFFLYVFIIFWSIWSFWYFLINSYCFGLYFSFDMLKNNPDVDCSRAKAKDFWSAETYDVKLPWKDLAVGRVCHGRGRGWDSLRRNESMPEHLVDACKRCARAFIRAEFQVCFVPPITIQANFRYALRMIIYWSLSLAWLSTILNECFDFISIIR